MKRIIIILIVIAAGAFIVWKVQDLGTANRLAKRIVQTPLEQLQPLADSLSAEKKLRLIMDLTVHPQQSIHTKAIMLLGMMKDQKAADLLVSLLSDSKRYKRDAALGAVGKLFGKDFGPDPAKWKQWLEAGGRDSAGLSGKLL